MKARLLNLWEKLRTSFWFVPTLMSAVMAAASAGTVAIDNSALGSKLEHSIGWLWSGGADGARSLLSTVASSMITVAGTVFSITIAALTLASSQFGPRLLRSFTRDLGNQVVLGTFLSSFLYCLLVLRTIRSQSEGTFVPYLSVTVGVLLAAASIGVLIYFIHHVATSIQAESLIASIGCELKQSIARLYPSDGQDRVEGDASSPSSPSHAVKAETSGYIQHIDRDSLVAVASEGDFLIQIPHRAGDFVSCGDVIAVTRGERLDDAHGTEIRGAFQLDQRRTPVQDVRYGVRQLTEIAARALSPGINDPFTAMECIDWLVDGLADAARRASPPGCRRDKDGKVRLVEEPVRFAELFDLSVEPLRIYGADSAMVVSHLLGALARLGAQLDQPAHRSVVLAQAERMADAARGTLSQGSDLRRVEHALDRVRVATDGGTGQG